MKTTPEVSVHSFNVRNSLTEHYYWEDVFFLMSVVVSGWLPY